MPNIDWGVVGAVTGSLSAASVTIGYVYGQFKRGVDEGTKQKQDERIDILEAALTETQIWKDRSERLEKDLNDISNKLTDKVNQLESIVENLKSQLIIRDQQINELKSLIMMETLPKPLIDKFDEITLIIKQMYQDYISNFKCDGKTENENL